MQLSNCRRLATLLNNARERTVCATTPDPGWALFGSAVMQLHGLRDVISDVDVAVDYRIWETLANGLNCSLRLPDRRHPPYLEFTDGGGKCHLFYDWRADEPEINIPDCIHMAQRSGPSVLDWWITPLPIILRQKEASLAYCMERYGEIPDRWKKHETDREKIWGYLSALRG